jgi:hypothetical protein
MALIEVGCERREVQATTGQSMEMNEHYAREYDRRGHARAAILKWEKPGAENKNRT